MAGRATGHVIWVNSYASGMAGVWLLYVIMVSGPISNLMTGASYKYRVPSYKFGAS